MAASEPNIVIGTSTGVYLSTDLGNNWNLIRAGQATGLAIIGNNIFASYWGSGVFLSTDRGENWADISSGLTDLNVYNLLFDNINLYASTEGGGIYQAKLADFGITDIDEKFIFSEEVTVYPNPCSDLITVVFPENQINTISIFNFLGIEIKRIEGVNLNSENRITISVSDLPDGSYYCTLNNQQNRIIKSFVILR